MVKKFLIATVLVLVVLTPAFAEGFDFFFGTVFTVMGTRVSRLEENYDQSSAEGYAEVTYTKNNLKADVKGAVSLIAGEETEYNLEKAFLRYRMNGFNNNKLTLTAGKFPSSWGLGYVDDYKVSDIITPEDNEYSVAASQSLGENWYVDIQGVLPFDNGEIVKIGAQARKEFSMDVLKEGRAAIVVNPTDNLILISCVADLNDWADFTVGADFSYCYDKDAETKTETAVIASALKNIVFSTETRDVILMDAIALRLNFEGFSFASVDLINKASLDLSERLDIVASTELSISSNSSIYTQIIGATYKIADGLNADGYVCLTNVEILDSISVVAKLTFNY